MKLPLSIALLLCFSIALANSYAIGPDTDSTTVFYAQPKNTGMLECEPTIILQLPETNTAYLYWAGTAIKVSNNYKVQANAHITMKAGFTIVLKPNTTILKGSQYVAMIESCQCENSFIADKFFTPNGDGQKDYWNIHNIENIKNVHVFIYDRYGKLLLDIKSNMLGWDGTLNGKNLPATDYWCRITYTDCNGNAAEQKSHFSLLR